MKNFKIGEFVYEVAINVVSKKVTVEPQKILFIGQQGLLVKGQSAEYGKLNDGFEEFIKFSSFNHLDKTEIFEKKSGIAWASTKQESESLKNEFNRLLSLKEQFSLAIN